MTADKPIWSVYMIRTVDGRLYSGVSTDVSRRYGEHLAGGPRAAKYLKAHKPQSLVFSKPIGSRSLAQKVEYHLKRLPRDQKETVIRRQVLTFDADTGIITV
jgi:putative endonuclease